MSLDVTLRSPDTSPNTPTPSNPMVEIEHKGEKKFISLEDFHRLWPNDEPNLVTDSPESILYSANITHNLTGMATAAGIYKPLWRPEEIGIEQAQQLTPLLEKGMKILTEQKTEMLKYNSPNGWGKYEDFVKFVGEYLEATKKWPTAIIEVSR